MISIFEFAFVAFVPLATVTVRAIPSESASEGRAEEIAGLVGLSLFLTARSAWAALGGLLVSGSSKKTAAMFCVASSALALSLFAIVAKLLSEEIGWSQPGGEFWRGLVWLSVFIAMFVGIADYLLCRRLTRGLRTIGANAIAAIGLLAACVQLGAMVGVAIGLRGFFGPSLFLGLAAWVVAVLLSASRSVMMYRAIRAWASGRAPLATPPSVGG